MNRSRACSGWTLIAFAIALAACDQVRSPARPTETAAVVDTSAQLLPPPTTAFVTWPCFSARAFSPVECSGRVTAVRSTVTAVGPATAPLTPLNLTSSVSGSTVTLQWTTLGGGDAASSFIVEAGSAPGSSNLARFDTGSSGTTLTVTSVPAGTYYVRVRGTNASGISGASNEIIVAVGGAAPCATVPSAPSGLTSSVSTSTVFLNWVASSGCPVGSYQIEAGSSPGQSNLAIVLTGNPSTSFSASNVAAGTYYVRVRAQNSAGSSAPSNEIVVTVVGVQTPGVISIVAYPIAASATDTSSHGITLSVDGQRVTSTFTYPGVPAVLPRFRGTLTPGTHQVVATMSSWDSLTFEVGSNPAGSVDATSFVLVSSSWTLTPFSTRVGCNGRVLFTGRATGSITFSFKVVAGAAASACPALPAGIG